LTPWIVVVVLLVFIHSWVATDVLFSKSGHIVKAMLTLILLMIMSISLLTIINDGLKRQEAFFKALGNVSLYALLLILAVGFIQFLMTVGVLSVSLSDQVTYLFSYRSSHRIQSVSGEPSQMIRSLILLLIMFYFFYFGRYKKSILVISFFAIAISGSTYGYLTVILMVLFYGLIFKPKIFLNYKLLMFSILTVIAFVSFRVAVLDNYTNAKIDAVLKVVFSLDMEVVTSILQHDGSIFQRVMNPIIGFISGSYSNFLGVGLDGYRYVYPEIIDEHFPYATKFTTVNTAVNGEGYITPKSLYSKVFSELGLIPFVLMTFYYLWAYIKVLHCKKYQRVTKALFIYILIIPLNADSIIYFNYFFALIFLHLLVVEENHYNLKSA